MTSMFKSSRWIRKLSVYLIKWSLTRQHSLLETKLFISFRPLQLPTTEIQAANTFAVITVSKVCSQPTTVDPTNSKWQVLQSTGDHIIPRQRTPLPNNSSGNKRKRNNGSWPAKPNNPSGKPCYKCLKLNKEGESKPDWVTTSHTPEACTMPGGYGNAPVNDHRYC